MKIDLKELFELNDTEHDQQIVQAILENVKAGAREGFDYLRFRYSLINLLKMNMDIPTGIKSAFTTANAMGIEKEELLQSLAYYESLIYKQKEEFNQTLKNQLQKQVEVPKSELQRLEDLKQENLRKIESLQREINEIESRKGSLVAEIEANQSKIESKRVQFKAVTDHLDAIIQNDKSLFNELL